MTEDFTIYKKFTDAEAAEDICEQLRENGIEYRLLDSEQYSLKILGSTQVDPGIVVNIQSSNFSKADKVLDSYYLKQIQNVDKTHYIFEFSDDELKEIVQHPYEWGPLDFQLAKKILKDKGQEFSEEYIENRKTEKLKELSKVKSVSTYKLILGYVFSILLPGVGLIIGLLIINTKNVLPNGQKPYTYRPSDRLHGKIIMAISIVWVTIIILKALLVQKDSY